ncbi:MAG: alpha-L-arabinofuranosidase C-terminal domain-containing protein, partial [Verrucomicrobiota bacterium]
MKGPSIKCFLDNKLIHDVQYQATKALYASATRATASGDVIVKIVNVSDTALTTDVQLRGGAAVDGPAQALVLTAEDPADENTLENPTKVAPVKKSLEVKG